MSKDRLTQSDPRVNASFMTPKKYLIILLLVGFVSGSNVGLYFLLSGDGVLQITTPASSGGLHVPYKGRMLAAPKRGS